MAAGIDDLTPQQMIDLREALRWSVNRVAAESGVAAEDISAIELGERPPAGDEAERISDTLRTAVGSTIKDSPRRLARRK